jgi:hypothetical protein
MATKKAMHEINIYNPYDYSNGNPFIVYHPEQKGRPYKTAAWNICWPGHSLSKNWYDYNNYVVGVFRPLEEKEVQLEVAKAKFHELFDEKFGNEELVLTPWQSWMQKSFVERRNKEIKMALKKDKKND